MRADSGEVLKGCAPERFLNEYLACSLLSKPREALNGLLGEEAPAASASNKSAAACRHAAHPFTAGMTAPRLGEAQGEAAEVTV
mgnify:CR=1 FL=1